MTDSWIWPI